MHDKMIHNPKICLELRDHSVTPIQPLEWSNWPLGVDTDHFENHWCRCFSNAWDHVMWWQCVGSNIYMAGYHMRCGIEHAAKPRSSPNDDFCKTSKISRFPVTTRRWARTSKGGMSRLTPVQGEMTPTVSRGSRNGLKSIAEEGLIPNPLSTGGLGWMTPGGSRKGWLIQSFLILFRFGVKFAMLPASAGRNSRSYFQRKKQLWRNHCLCYSLYTTSQTSDLPPWS